MVEDHAAQIAEHQVWVVEQDGTLIGGLVLMAHDDYLLLDNIAVHPDTQGQGLGHELLDFADTEARRQGYRVIKLYTHHTMTENIALYTKLGWHETGRGKAGPYERVYMEKGL